MYILKFKSRALVLILWDNIPQSLDLDWANVKAATTVKKYADQDTIVEQQNKSNSQQRPQARTV